MRYTNLLQIWVEPVYLFTGKNDADVMHNSALINLNVLGAAHNRNCKRIFYSSSACVYPEENQKDPNNPICSEDSVYPANPDSEYGWEKLFSERMYLNFNKNYSFKNQVARYHNIFGPMELGMVGKKKPLLQFVEKLLQLKVETLLKFGGMVNKPGHFFLLMNVLKVQREL